MLHVIGDEKPRGICGSGIVELLAGMFLNGWVDALGNLNPDASSRIIRVKNHLDEEREEAAVCYAWAAESKQQEDLVFTQTDIHEFIRTKAAAHTMVAYLIEEFGLHTDDIAHFYLAGAFGKYLDLESAITIGMYPDLPREKFVMLGNSSLDGAQKLLLDRHLVVRATELVKKITYVQFGNAGDFVEKMHAAQFLPYTDLDECPEREGEAGAWMNIPLCDISHPNPVAVAQGIFEEESKDGNIKRRSVAMKILLTAINAKYIHSNLAVYSLKASAGIYEDQVELAEYTINHQMDEIFAGIYRRKPELLLMSCYIWNRREVTETAASLKKVLPNLKIWAGGPEVTYDAEHFLRQNPAFDGVMIGEGEQTFYRLLDYYIGKNGTLEQIPGIAFREVSKGEAGGSCRCFRCRGAGDQWWISVSEHITADSHPGISTTFHLFIRICKNLKIVSSTTRRAVAVRFPAATASPLSISASDTGAWSW